MTTDNRSIVQTLPNWVRLSLAVALIIALPLAFYFDVPMAICAFVGPLFLAHMWTGKRFAYSTYDDDPGLFWAISFLFALLTLIAFWRIYEQLIVGAQ